MFLELHCYIKWKYFQCHSFYMHFTEIQPDLCGIVGNSLVVEMCKGKMYKLASALRQITID